MAIQYIQPGKSSQSAYIEWMFEYNEVRPHESLDNLAPIEYRTQTCRRFYF